MADASNQPVTTPATTPESKILEMASSIITGEIFQGDESDVVEFRKAFGTYLEGLKTLAKNFDEQLVTLRRVNGADYLPNVEHFRKPREDKKTTNSLLDALKL